MEYIVPDVSGVKQITALTYLDSLVIYIMMKNEAYPGLDYKYVNYISI
jgi:hypothetical protein